MHVISYLIYKCKIKNTYRPRLSDGVEPGGIREGGKTGEGRSQPWGITLRIPRMDETLKVEDVSKVVDGCKEDIQVSISDMFCPIA